MTGLYIQSVATLFALYGLLAKCNAGLTRLQRRDDPLGCHCPRT